MCDVRPVPQLCSQLCSMGQCHSAARAGALDDIVGEPTPVPADTLDGLGHRVQFPAPFGVEKLAQGARHRDGGAPGDAPRLEVVQHHGGARKVQCELDHRRFADIQLASQERRNPVARTYTSIPVTVRSLRAVSSSWAPASSSLRTGSGTNTRPYSSGRASSPPKATVR